MDLRRPRRPIPSSSASGDIASCATQAQLDAAATRRRSCPAIQGSIFTTGDNVYPTGTAAEFTNCYEPSWGAVQGRTRPVPGNHDWGNGAPGSLAGYFGYFGAERDRRRRQELLQLRRLTRTGTS